MQPKAGAALPAPGGAPLEAWGLRNVSKGQEGAFLKGPLTGWTCRGSPLCAVPGVFVLKRASDYDRFSKPESCDVCTRTGRP